MVEPTSQTNHLDNNTMETLNPLLANALNFLKQGDVDLAEREFTEALAACSKAYGEASLNETLLCCPVRVDLRCFGFIRTYLGNIISLSSPQPTQASQVMNSHPRILLAAHSDVGLIPTIIL